MIAILGCGLAGELDAVLEESGLKATRYLEPDVSELAERPWPLIIDAGTAPWHEPSRAPGPVMRLRESAGRIDVGPVFNTGGGRCAACFREEPGGDDVGDARADLVLRPIAAGLAAMQIIALLRASSPPFVLAGTVTIGSRPPGVSYALAPSSPGCRSCGRPGAYLDHDSERLYAYEDTVCCMPGARSEDPRATRLSAHPRPYYTMPRIALPPEAGPVSALIPAARRRPGRRPSASRGAGHAYLIAEGSGGGFYLNPYQRALVGVPGQPHTGTHPPSLARHELVLVGDVADKRRRMGGRALRECYVEAGVLLAALAIRGAGGPWQLRARKVVDQAATCDRLRLDPGHDTVAAVIEVRPGPTDPTAGLRATGEHLDQAFARRPRSAGRERPPDPPAVRDILAAVRSGLVSLWGPEHALENLSLFVLARRVGTLPAGLYDVAGDPLGELTRLAAPGRDDVRLLLHGRDPAAAILIAGRLADALREQGPSGYQDLLVRASCAMALACAEAAALGVGARAAAELPSTWLGAAAGVRRQLLAGAVLTGPATRGSARGRQRR